MTNREWLNSLSNENFMFWLYEKTGIKYFKDDKLYCFEYYPTKHDITAASTHSQLALQEWLDKERDETGLVIEVD